MAQDKAARAVEGAEQVDTDRILTVPNVLSGLRLVGVPIFLWLILRGDDGWALIVLAVSGITDYLDGKIARRFHLVSRVGQLLDPIADRLYIASTLIGLAWRSIIPWWLVGLLLLREVVMAVLLILLKRVGQVGLPVHFVGKAATFNLLYAFPIILLGQLPSTVGTVALPIGWAFAWWGVGLYWLSVILYAGQALPLLRRGRSSPALDGTSE
ncbi:MAG: CDP-alcohol phosphatidyltransferase family protein [Candidatus Phosphoribacter sp.]